MEECQKAAARCAIQLARCQKAAEEALERIANNKREIARQDKRQEQLDVDLKQVDEGLSVRNNDLKAYPATHSLSHAHRSAHAPPRPAASRDLT